MPFNACREVIGFSYHRICLVVVVVVVAVVVSVAVVVVVVVVAVFDGRRKSSMPIS